jgi:hypothetical protein
VAVHIDTLVYQGNGTCKENLPPLHNFCRGFSLNLNHNHDMDYENEWVFSVADAG